MAYQAPISTRDGREKTTAPMSDFLGEFSNKLQRGINEPFMGQMRLLDLLILLVLFALVVIAERIFRRLVVLRLLRRTQMDPALQFAVSRILGYLLLIVGFYIALQVAGVNMSSLAVLAGALGVGLGFGLQNIISNFVSGVIILAERPISIGDRIEIGGVAGQVRHISLRSTTVVTNDNISIIVPNADFITHTVTNWSHGDDKVRIRMPIVVAYGSDVEKVKELLLSVARENPQALKEPAPSVFFDSFAENGFKFELAVWTEEMTFNPRRFRSNLNYAIEKKFRDNKIEVPLAQREIHLRSGTLVLQQPAASDRL
jgi:small-conductance mechanosensitive channel